VVAPAVVWGAGLRPAVSAAGLAGALAAAGARVGGRFQGRSDDARMFDGECADAEGSLKRRSGEVPIGDSDEDMDVVKMMRTRSPGEDEGSFGGTAVTRTVVHETAEDSSDVTETEEALDIVVPCDVDDDDDYLAS